MGVLNRPITRLPTAESGVSAEVVIRDMHWADALFWHGHVQPLIDRHYRHHATDVPDEIVRADVGWNWKRIYLYALAHTCGTIVPGNRSGAARGLVVAVQTLHGGSIPLGMLTVVPEFFCRVKETSGTRSFAWYLSDAPAELYDALAIRPLRKMAVALLDCAIQAGIDIGTDGQLLLHADPAGGRKLHGFYQERCGMSRLPAGSAAVSLLRRSAADEYYHLGPGQSRVFCARLDPLRAA